MSTLGARGAVRGAAQLGSQGGAAVGKALPGIRCREGGRFPRKRAQRDRRMCL